MAKLYTSVTELIGATPLLSLQRLAKAQGLYAEILAKLEFFNPTGSAKDRAALAMLQDAEEKGLLVNAEVIPSPSELLIPTLL